MNPRETELMRKTLIGDVEKQLVLTEVRHETGSFMGEYEVNLDKFDFIQGFLDCKLEDLRNGEVFVFDSGEFAELCKNLEISAEGKNSSACLSVVSFWTPMKYIVHTNRELDLMIEGCKPMAVFDYDASEYDETSFTNQKFSDFYDSHNIEKIITPGFGGRPRYFFVLEGQNWRVPAYNLLMDIVFSMGYSSYVMWMEGRLLGYSEEENKRFLSGRFDFENKCEIG